MWLLQESSFVVGLQWAVCVCRGVLCPRYPSGILENRQGGGGYFSGPCWARVNTTHEGVGGYFSPPVLGPC